MLGQETIKNINLLKCFVYKIIEKEILIMICPECLDDTVQENKEKMQYYCENCKKCFSMIDYSICLKCNKIFYNEDNELGSTCNDCFKYEKDKKD